MLAAKEKETVESLKAKKREEKEGGPQTSAQ
jgi:hypothetical protein